MITPANAPATFAAQMAARDFRKTVLRSLASKGIYVVDAHIVPDANGSTAFADKAYTLLDNGTGRVRTYAEVLALAGE